MTNIFASNGLQLNNKSNTWYIENINNNIVTLTYNNFSEIYVNIDLRNIIYNANLSKSDCYDKINAGGINVIYPLLLTIGKLNNKTEKNVQYSLNPYKSYFIKNGQKYPLKIIDIFNLRVSPQDKYYDFSQDIQKKGCVSKSFSSPLICGELENTTLVIEGIKINDQLLPPIKLQFNFDNFQSIPLSEKFVNTREF